MSMPDGVLLLTGPPGSGKTTTARLITAGTALGAHIETDTFFRFVRGGYVEPWLPASHQQNVIVMRAIAAAAATYAEGGYLTVVDGIISPRWFFTPLRDALAGRGHTVSYAILRPPLATCIARAGARAGNELRKPDVIAQLWDDFAGIGELGRHVIEITDDDPARVAAAVTSQWQVGTLRT